MLDVLGQLPRAGVQVVGADVDVPRHGAVSAGVLGDCVTNQRDNTVTIHSVTNSCVTWVQCPACESVADSLHSGDRALDTYSSSSAPCPAPAPAPPSVMQSPVVWLQRRQAARWAAGTSTCHPIDKS